MCLAPDDDFVRAFRKPHTDIITDRIEAFTADGIRLRSGRRLPADVIGTATGLTMQLFASLEVVMNGERIDPSKRIAYMSMMLSGLHNHSWTMGLHQRIQNAQG